MFRLDRIRKSYEGAGSFNEQVNLFGFISDQLFLTKSGDLGLAMSVAGVDYECLDSALIEHLTKRLESASKLFDENCRVYQYLFKQNHENVPHQSYENPVVSAAVENRIVYLRNKADALYSLRIYYVLLLDGARQQRSLTSALAHIAGEPRCALRELRRAFSADKRLEIIDGEIERLSAELLSKARSFILQVSDFLSVEILARPKLSVS
jgi:hypothetical protein